MRDVVARAVATAIEAPAGPVHLNLPFRASLLPDGPLAPEPRCRRPRPHHDVGGGESGCRATATSIARSADRGAAAGRSSWSGPLDRAGAAGRHRATGRRPAAHPSSPTPWPTCAWAPTTGRELVDAARRAAPVARRSAPRHAPDLVLRLGAHPDVRRDPGVPGADGDAEQLVVDDGGWNEPTLLGRHHGPRRPGGARRCAGRPPRRDRQPAAASLGGRPGWMPARAADTAIRAASSPHRGAIRGWRVRGARRTSLPDGALLVRRQLDAGARPRRVPGGRRYPGPLPRQPGRQRHRRRRLVGARRGRGRASGRCCWSSATSSFVHDLNALVAARLHDLSADHRGHRQRRRRHLLVPAAGHGRSGPSIGLPEHFEELFGTPHGVDVLAVARVLGAETAELEPGRHRCGRGRLDGASRRPGAAPAHRPSTQRGAAPPGPGRRDRGHRGDPHRRSPDGVALRRQRRRAVVVRCCCSTGSPAAARPGRRSCPRSARDRRVDRGRPAGPRRLRRAATRAPRGRAARRRTSPRILRRLDAAPRTSSATPLGHASRSGWPSTRPALVAPPDARVAVGRHRRRQATRDAPGVADQRWVDAARQRATWTGSLATGRRSRSSPARRDAAPRSRGAARVAAPAQPTRGPGRQPAGRGTGRHGARSTTGCGDIRAPTLVISGRLDPRGTERAAEVAAAIPDADPRDHRRCRPCAAPRDAGALPGARPRLPRDPVASATPSATT